MVMGMADYINREAVRNELYDADAITMRGVAILNNFPSANVAEVVRCNECRYCDPERHYCDHPMSTSIPIPRKPDDFCSYGERKDNGKE
jgi:hypothetical protein